VLVYDAKSGQVESYIGAGVAPEAATIDRFTARGWKSIPENNIWAQLIPASPDVMVALLQKYGTKSFTEVSAPAIRLAEEGFPVHYAMMNNLDLSLVERLGFTILMPYNSEVYLHKQWWRTLQHGEVFRRPSWPRPGGRWSLPKRRRLIMGNRGTRRSKRCGMSSTKA